MMTKIKSLFFHLLESMIRNISGPAGRKLRYHYYRWRFRKCGKNVIIDVGVIVEGPEYMELGDNVWINHYTQLIAGTPSNLQNRVMKFRLNPCYRGEQGCLYIGSGVGIGAYNILHAYGGLLIGNNSTTSAGVKIYSFSHYHRDDAHPTRITYANGMATPANQISCISSPIVVGEGCWLGLDVIVLGGNIGDYTFVTSGSLVLEDLPANSYASGQPACRLRPRFEEPYELLTTVPSEALLSEAE